MSITEKLLIDLKYLTDKIEVLGIEYSSELNRHKKELENIRATYSKKKKQELDLSNAAISKHKESLAKYEKTIQEQKNRIKDIEKQLKKRFSKIDVDIALVFVSGEGIFDELFAEMSAVEKRVFQSGETPDRNRVARTDGKTGSAADTLAVVDKRLG